MSAVITESTSTFMCDCGKELSATSVWMGPYETNDDPFPDEMSVCIQKHCPSCNRVWYVKFSASALTYEEFFNKYRIKGIITK